MYTLIRRLTTSELITRQVPAFGIALMIAEVFYKFHSFTLECLTFSVTWFAIDFAATKLLPRDNRPRTAG